ncbi:acyl carrier protein [Micromonospora wenchangensis]|jgi:acyl carrier protein|uniref:Carrier domain-containing protein n=1 Tax=Micromonospora wenchangensis TaxID=1185415 RepID=A0A2D0AX47_9ACTN|nr:acyl carrier protein [Micromonospora wenchangensis]OWV11498.1 hypothetical protein B5D80_04185 [Micromonospora wenchangensis]
MTTVDATRSEIVSRVTQWARDVFHAPAAEVDETTVLMDIEGADSIRMLHLLGRLEAHYGVVLMAEDTWVPATVGELAEDLRQAVGRRPVDG